MAYTVSKVRHSKPYLLLTAAGDALTSARRVDDQIEQGRQSMDRLREGWAGTASDAADKQYGELIGYQEQYRDQLLAVRAVLEDHGPTLVEYRDDLDQLVTNVEDKWDVADDGSVSMGDELTRYVRWNPTQFFKVEAMRIELELAVKLLLAKFEAEDLATGAELREKGRALT